jgi:peroxiredoxin
MKKTILALAIAGIAALGTAASYSFADNAPQARAAAAAKATVGQAAPAFTLKDQDGNDVNLAQFQGKVVVLEWFNNECPYVKKFYGEGHMNKWAAAYKEKGVTWLAINSTRAHDVAHNKQVAGEWKIDRPILSDQDGAVAKAYGAKTTPHMYIVDGTGKLVYAGAIDSEKSTDTADIATAKNYVAKALDEVLAGKSVSEPETKAYGCGIKQPKE